MNTEQKLQFGIYIVAAMFAERLHKGDMEIGMADALSETEMDRIEYTPDEFAALPEESQERIRNFVVAAKERLHQQASFMANKVLEYLGEQGVSGEVMSLLNRMSDITISGPAGEFEKTTPVLTVSSAVCIAEIYAQQKVATLEQENFKLAAMQCDKPYGDDYGNKRCSYQERIIELEKENETLKEANKFLLEKLAVFSKTTNVDPETKVAEESAYHMAYAIRFAANAFIRDYEQKFPFPGQTDNDKTGGLKKGICYQCLKETEVSAPFGLNLCRPCFNDFVDWSNNKKE